MNEAVEVDVDSKTSIPQFLIELALLADNVHATSPPVNPLSYSQQSTLVSVISARGLATGIGQDVVAIRPRLSLSLSTFI
jgi:hypothetical protein